MANPGGASSWYMPGLADMMPRRFLFAQPGLIAGCAALVLLALGVWWGLASRPASDHRHVMDHPGVERASGNTPLAVTMPRGSLVQVPRAPVRERLSAAHAS